MPIAYDTARFKSEGEALLVGLRAAGCTCSPAVGDRDGLRVTVHHDGWCALLRRQDVN